MPTSLPMPTKAVGDIFTTTLWNSYLRDNMNKLLNTGHRVLTVAQFAALSSPEGTKGVVAPDEVYLEVDAANGVLWHLAYESGEPTYKWRYIGGPPLTSEVAAVETTTSTAYAALSTAGPAVAVPRGGDYDVAIEGVLSSASNGNRSRMSYDIGGTGAVDADNAVVTQPAGVNGGEASVHRSRRKTALTSVTLTAKYRIDSAGSGSFSNRLLSVTPVRIRHDA